MVDRLYIERILRVNGIDTRSHPADLQDVLVKIGLSQNDIEAYLAGDTHSSQSSSNQEASKQTDEVSKTVNGAQTLFKTDNALEPEYISSLLGIRIQVTNFVKRDESTLRKKGIVIVQVLCTVLLSFGFALAGIVALMWYTKTGIFHPTILF